MKQLTEKRGSVALVEIDCEEEPTLGSHTSIRYLKRLLKEAEKPEY